MADNLARSSSDSLDEDPSLDSILNRLNSLGESSQDEQESARPLRGVPDLAPEEKASIPDSADEVSEPATLTVVDESDQSDSPFRSRGLFDVSTADDPADTAAVVAAPVVSPDALSSLVSKGKEESQESESDQAEVVEIEDEDEDEEKPERIDYFADLHVGEPTQIAGVPNIAQERDELDLELEPGFTVQQAFSKHPEGKPPEGFEPDEEAILTDTHGLLADPLDIKDVATTLDGAGYQEHFSHGVQFPGMGGTSLSNVDPSDPLYVENPYENMEPSSKGFSLKSIAFGLLLIAAIIVLVMIIGDGEAVDDLRDGVTVIAD